MSIKLTAFASLAILTASLPSYAQNAIVSGPSPVAPIAPTVLQEGCAGDVAKLCPTAAAGGAQAQCLQGGKAAVSEACQAAMSQVPAPGIAKHLGFDPPPTPPAAPQPVNLPNVIPPQAAPSPAQPATMALPPPIPIAPTVVLAPPPSVINGTSAPVTPAPPGTTTQ